VVVGRLHSVVVVVVHDYVDVSLSVRYLMCCGSFLVSPLVGVVLVVHGVVLALVCVVVLIVVLVVGIV
jgi:hypothetical protein